MTSKLRQFKIFQDFPDCELVKIERFSRLKNIEANQVIYQQNQPCNEIFFVIEGRIKLISKSHKSDGNIVQFINADDAFCLLSIFSTNGYLTQAISCEESLLLAVSAPKLLLYLQSNRLLLWRLTSAAVQITETLIHHLNILADYSADQKLAAYLLSLDGKKQQSLVKQVDLANYLSLTPETLSRSYKKLKKAKLIELSQGQVQISDRKKLVQMLH